MDVLDGVPKHLLGYEIKTRAQIVFSFLVPASLELIAYLIQTTADVAVAIQHFRMVCPHYGGLSLAFICLPALVCFISIMTSPLQWPEAEGYSAENLKFLLVQLFNLLFFPIGALYRFCRRIFWSIESLFYRKDTYERQHSVSKAAESSPFELYHFVQAYTQAAPQIILQLYILLRENIWRNYETTNVQILSIVFSLINIATITMSFQRFESQKIVGRDYPWSSSIQIQQRQRKFCRTVSHIEEIREKEKRNLCGTRNFPENEKILERFHSHQGLQQTTSDSSLPGDQTTDSIGSEFIQENGTYYTSTKKICEKTRLSGDEELISSQTNDEILPDELDAVAVKNQTEDRDYMDAIVLVEEISLNPQSEVHSVESMKFDGIPEVPPPSPPQKKISPEDGSTNGWQHYVNRIKRLSTLKDMLVMNAEIYIKEHVPHPPQILLQHTQSRKKDETPLNTCSTCDCKNNKQMDLSGPESDAKLKSSGASNLADTTDFFLPRRRKMIKGVEQDDFTGKFVSFFGWIMFIFMRMISLSVFAFFYLEEFMYLVCFHYFFMLLCLIYESKFQEKIERILFYIFLSYVYIFVILEFRIKFKHLRHWYFGYFTLVMLQNFTITIMWYTTAEFDSWWFYYLFSAIMTSGILCLACMIVYYCILKPNDVILLERE